MHRRRAAIALVAAALVAACSSRGGLFPAARVTTTTSTTSSTSSTASTVTPAAEFVPEPISWAPCGGRFKCATLRVPLDYTDPTGPSIELALNELPARQPGQRIGVLLVNNGGPGGSGLDFVEGGLAFGGAILDRFDVVGFDPRGVGKSTGLECGATSVPAFRAIDSAPDTPEEQAQLEAAAQAVADDCAAVEGEMIPHVGTDNVVRDMDSIRRALGEPQINYLGISYGTLLGLRYAQLFPQNARAIALDGVVDPTQGFRAFLRQQTIAFDREIQAYLDAGDAAATYDAIAQQIETAPIPGRNGRALGPAELATAALIPTYDEPARSIFYSALAAAQQGDGTPMLRIADAYYGSVDFPLYTAVECVDSPHPVGAIAYREFAQELIALSPRVGGAIANELLPCAFWPAPVQDITGPIAAPNSPPILVIGNTGDAATPYQQAVDVAATLANGHLLTFESGGHAAYGKSTCVSDAEDAYFVDLVLPAEGTTCTN